MCITESHRKNREGSKRPVQSNPALRHLEGKAAANLDERSVQNGT
jgi:hypothetical protein